MDDLPSGIGGIALVVIGALVAWKAAKTLVKVLMLALVAAGAYLLYTWQAGA